MVLAVCGDIGGTNANLCLAEIGSEISINAPVQKHTSDYHDFIALIEHFLSPIQEKPNLACFAVAGPLKNQRVEMTNTSLIVDGREVSEKTPLKKTLIINDFEAIGYATNVLEKRDVKVLNQGSSYPKSTRAVLGAGTGLGKNILIFDETVNGYVPHASEGGHADFPIQSQEEMDLVTFIAKKNKLDHSVVYEHLLSGHGLETIYEFLRERHYPQEPPTRSAKDISLGKKSNPCCKKTFELFITYFARCAKNFALDTYSIGGIFIAGGIAAANHDSFGTNFLQEFTAHSSSKLSSILKDIPICVIVNYQISLKGAAFALKVKEHIA